MTRKDALENLSSNSSHDRLKGARFLAGNCHPTDLPALRKALRNEAVAYVRSGLELAIKRASKLASLTAVDMTEFEIPPDVRAQIRNEVTAEVTGQILHEIAAPVGLIASAAAREIVGYRNSKTHKQVENLKRVFHAIEQLKSAAGSPKPEEFDLAELLEDMVSEIDGEGAIGISLHGVKPMVITSDRALLRLALSNGIRNAIEAAADTTNPHAVVVNWGETDVDYWVAVVDQGSGVVGSTESAFGIGKTTKKGHSGFGLAIARQAAETLDGACTLQPATKGGARFELRWPI